MDLSRADAWEFSGWIPPAMVAEIRTAGERAGLRQRFGEHQCPSGDHDPKMWPCLKDVFHCLAPCIDVWHPAGCTEQEALAFWAMLETVRQEKQP